MFTRENQEAEGKERRAKNNLDYQTNRAENIVE